MKSYDKLLTATINAYIRPMLDQMFGKGFTSGMTEEELDEFVKAYANAPYRCGECGQMVEGTNESSD